MGNPHLEQWLDAVIKVENEEGETGTGFLVARHVSPEDYRVFLVTNKHVLADDEEKRRKAHKIIFHLNLQPPGGRVGGNTVHYEGFSSKDWKEHSDPDVDVLAIDITKLINKLKIVRGRWATYDIMALPEKLKEWEISIGDEIFNIGHPGIEPELLSQDNTNFPIVRQGIIATQIGKPIYDLDNGRRRKIRGFLIDGATIPGSSGSPVILKPIAGRYMKGSVELMPPPPLLLGIVAERRYAPDKEENRFIEVSKKKEREFLDFSGIGMAFDAKTIQETIELFF